MTLSSPVLRKIDDALRSEFDQEKGEWMAKVPISGATKVVWQRYCQAVGVGMGEGVALLMLHELASIAGDGVDTLADRLEAREAEMKAHAQELKDREKELKQRDWTLFLREVDLEDREREAARGRASPSLSRGSPRSYGDQPNPNLLAARKESRVVMNPAGASRARSTSTATGRPDWNPDSRATLGTRPTSHPWKQRE